MVNSFQGKYLKLLFINSLSGPFCVCVRERLGVEEGMEDNVPGSPFGTSQQIMLETRLGPLDTPSTLTGQTALLSLTSGC